MEFKIDTKEKFIVVTPVDSYFSDNVAGALGNLCIQILSQSPKNIVLNIAGVTVIDEEACEDISQWQQRFYENSASFVICGMTTEIEAVFDKLELTDILNITPTESEAWDIVQMEEIERELLDGEDIEFQANE